MEQINTNWVSFLAVYTKNTLATLRGHYIKFVEFGEGLLGPFPSFCVLELSIEIFM